MTQPPTLVITRGYPGSGKTTEVERWLLSDESAKRARVNRDDLRQSMFGAEGVLPFPQEELITTVQQAQVKALLAKGFDVAVDDTNLRAKYARAWVDLAVAAGARFEVWDFDTDVETCLARNERRRSLGGRYVKPEAIRSMAQKFPISRWPEITPTPKAETGPLAPYVSLFPNATKTWLVDIDGTLAHNDGHRGFHDYDKVDGDKPRAVVIDLVKTLDHDGHDIIFMSGRKEHCREKTHLWLAKYLGAWALNRHLFMRADGDNRNDAVVKAELFDAHVRHSYNVVGVLDDRDRVVAMWRSLGLDCLQVAPGDF